VVWSAGARVRRATFFGEAYDEELSLDPAHVRLDRLNAGAPFLKVHELDTLDAVIGSVVPGSARIENGRGIAVLAITTSLLNGCGTVRSEDGRLATPACGRVWPGVRR
jgi:hypothetical protein